MVSTLDSSFEMIKMKNKITILERQLKLLVDRVSKLESKPSKSIFEMIHEKSPESIPSDSKLITSVDPVYRPDFVQGTAGLFYVVLHFKDSSSIYKPVVALKEEQLEDWITQLAVLDHIVIKWSHLAKTDEYAKQNDEKVWEIVGETELPDVIE